MMGATFPAIPIERDIHRQESDAMRYLRLEYGADSLAWLTKEVEDGTLDRPVPEPRYRMRVMRSLRSLAARVAAILF